MFSETVVNLAANRSASQSSTAGSQVASNALDSRDVCSRTKQSTAPWWKVDLGDVYTVHDVVVATCKGSMSKGACSLLNV